MIGCSTIWWILQGTKESCLIAHGTWIRVWPLWIYTHTPAHTHSTFIQQSSSTMETSMPGLLHHHHHTQSGPHLLQLGLQSVCVCVCVCMFLRMFLCVWDHVCPCVVMCACVCELGLGSTLRTRSLRKWKLCRASHTPKHPQLYLNSAGLFLHALLVKPPENSHSKTHYDSNMT